MADKRKATLEAKKQNESARTLSKGQQRKLKNKQDNEARQFNNEAQMALWGLSPETYEKQVNRVVKHGKKVHVNTITVVKSKRPSKLVRRERRRHAALELGTQITSLEDRIFAEED